MNDGLHATQKMDQYENSGQPLLKLREPVSCLTHFVGFLAAIPILVTMLILAARTNNPWCVVSIAVFGASLLLLYGASAFYHGVMASKEQIAIFRRIDHMMIFILIAGTYTPVCLVPLYGKWGFLLFGLVWSIALFGILLKIFFFGAPRWLSTAIYVLMGWLVLAVFAPLMKAVPLMGIFLLAAGGITYTLGAVIYALKWPKLSFRYFGFHEIFLGGVDKWKSRFGSFQHSIAECIS